MTSPTQQQLLKAVTNASVLVALVLIGLKAWALWRTGSVSVLASLVDSFLDSLASIITALAVRYSLVPADDEHRFGHGKAQSLAGLSQAILVAGSALFLFVQAVQRLLQPRAVEELSVGVGVMVVSMLLTGALVAFQRYVVSRTDSVAIKADSAHYLSDLLSNGAVLVALIGVGFGWVWLDPLLAIAVGVLIVASAIGIANQAVQELLDRELPSDVQEKILRAAESVAGVLDVHDLRTRRAGHIDIIQMHIALDDELPLHQAHAISDEVENRLRQLRPGADILIHQDPISLVDLD